MEIIGQQSSPRRRFRNRDQISFWFPTCSQSSEYEQRHFSYMYHGRVAVQRMEIHSLSIVHLQSAMHCRLVVEDIDADKSTWPLFGTPTAIRKKRLFGQLEIVF